ncbi:unnamed protein product [Peniophora sp. CBMAI 1063]|nr:unnamed protein product [Peniophora sp. CBMAI 1063]
MPYVDPANYPTDIPEGGWHADVDDADDFRLPSGLDTDLFLYRAERTDGSLFWVVKENARTAARSPTAEQLAAAIGFSKDRLIRALWAEIGTLHAQPPQPPQPQGPQGPAQAAAARPQQVRLPLPRSFSGVPTKEGVYNPEPRDFTVTISHYVYAQSQELGVAFDEDRKIRVFSSFLEQSAARWYHQLLQEREITLRSGQPYTGPLNDTDALVAAFLREYEDVNIRATAKHKIRTLQQDSTAEAHVRFFKEYAMLSGYGEEALIDWFKSSLKVALKDKVNGQGKQRLTTLEGWYEDAILFDRQYREDQLDRALARKSSQPATGNTSARNQSAGANNNTGRPTGGSQQQQAPRNANQWQPRNGNWRPWGAPAQQQRAPAPAAKTGVVSMDIDAANAAMACYRCGENHLARNCDTPTETIRQKYGRDRMIPFPPGYRARATTFANVDDFAASLSPADRADLARVLQSGGEAPAAPPAQALQQGFASGSS